MARKNFTSNLPFIIILGLFIHEQCAFGFTKTGTTYTTDGSMQDVSDAIGDANIGDLITMPAGTFIWGDAGAYLSIFKSVKIQGAGIDQTIINISPTASTWTSGVIRMFLDGDESFGGVTINGPAGSNYHSPFSIHAYLSPGIWRISNVKYIQQSGDDGYFVFVHQSNSGLIDNCDVTGGAGSAELIMMRGEPDSWDTDNSLGEEGNVFIENCTFRGQGYVCDANSNSRMVVRYCTITDNMKIDGHGVWSNSNPTRGVRHMEIYGNHWTSTAGAWTAMEIRGGSGMIFNNVSDLGSGINGAWFYLTEYGVFNNNGVFGQYQTPANYPIRDQIGRGKYSSPGDYTTATSEPMYVWNNIKGGVQWPFTNNAIPMAAITLYGSTFDWEDIIKADRDYFLSTSSFNGTTGIGSGTAAQMQLITPTKNGVGFWVTDEGEWNSQNAGSDGQLYTWNVNQWMLKYTPYCYPHPLVSGNGCTNIPLSIAKNSSSSDIKVYPIPNNGNFMLDLSSLQSETVYMNIVNILGEIVHTEIISVPAGKTNVPISLGQNAKGVYNIQIFYKKRTVNKRFIVN